MAHMLLQKENLQCHPKLDHKSSVIRFGYLLEITTKLLQLIYLFFLPSIYPQV